MRGDGQPPPESADAAWPDGPADIDVAWLDAPDILLSPPAARSARDEAASLTAAVAAHVLVFAAFLAPVSGIGANGSDPDAIGIEIVTAAPALQSRSTERGRGAASGDMDVRERDGANATVPQETASLDSRAVEQPKPEDAAAPKADLVVKDWVEPPRSPDPSAQEPVIAPRAADGRTQDAQSVLRPTQADTLMSVTNSIPAAELLAQIEGGAAARGREQTAFATDAMAGARAGRRDEYRLALYKAVLVRPPASTVDFVGSAKAEFALRLDGSIRSVRLTKSSGSSVIDDSILAALRTARFPAPPGGLREVDLVFDMDFNFISAAKP